LRFGVPREVTEALRLARYKLQKKKIIEKNKI
jgi:hypothetical protein